MILIAVMKKRISGIAVFILLLGLGAGSALPLPARAAEKFLAVVIAGDLPRYREAHESFVKILRAGGMNDEKVEIYVQTPHPDPTSLANSIRKAVGIQADLIVTYGTMPTLAAKKGARGIPVLFADVYDPVGLEIVRDLAVPGGEITGVSSQTPLETLIKTYREVQQPRKLAVLYSAEDPASVSQTRELEALGERFGFSLHKINVLREEDVLKGLDGIPEGTGGVFVSECTLLHLQLDTILDFARRRTLPVVSQIPGLCERGALMTLSADPIEQGQLLGVHALQIFSGQSAHTLPIRTPRKVFLVINLKVAQELNLKVPFQALSLATRVIK